MKSNLKSNIIFNMLSTIVKVKITKCLDWHIEGEVVERNVKVEQVEAGYVEKMKKDL